MARLTSPEITITFIEKGASAIQRSERGVVALVLKDSALASGPVITVYSVSDIPAGLSAANKKYIQDALTGYQVAPKKVIVYIMTVTEENDLDACYTAMETYFETHVFDWMAIPTVATDSKASEIAIWIKGLRSNFHLSRKAVLPNQTADSEGIVNVTSSLYTADGTEVTPEQTTPRIAGLIAGTPMTIAATYAPLLDYADCTRLTKDQADEAVGAGKLVYIFDGEKVKLNRAVNSFVTTTDSKGDSFKKIKLVEIMDMIRDDIHSTLEDSYIGKYANSYDNKCLLITAVNAYFNELIRTGLLASGYCEIDLVAQRNYLQSQGEAVEDMTDQEIKEGNTGSHVFLRAVISILDAMEDIQLEIYI